MRPYSRLVPMPHARKALPAAKLSIRAEFALGRPDLKAPKKQFPDNDGRDEYLCCLGYTLLNRWVFRKEGNYDIGIEKIFTTPLVLIIELPNLIYDLFLNYCIKHGEPLFPGS